MGDASAQRNGAKWLLVVLLVSAIFGVLIIAAFINNEYKRGVPVNAEPPTRVNGNH